MQEVPAWYHTLDLPHEVTTPGWFDLRPVSPLLPWPDVRGKRCLDVATYDGFLAFELERRGAAEVVASDITDHADWDWPIAARNRSGRSLDALVGPKGLGFELARQALGSRVEKSELNVYSLSPEAAGRFDVVVCGSLLLHLRDPVRALEAIRSVCDGVFLSVEAISLPLTVLLRHRPAAELSPDDDRCQWWTVNAAGHRRLAEAAGFEVIRTVGPFVEAFGAGHRIAGARARDPRSLAVNAFRRAFAGGNGVPHTALLARPRL